MASRHGPWVHKLTTERLHALAGHLQRKSTTVDLSPRQELLWGRVVKELEFRHRSRRDSWCVGCDLCRSPF